MSSYLVNRKWSDQFIPQIKQIVGPLLLEESSFEVDTKQAADLVVMRAKNLTIACRVRRPGFMKKYPYQFTIRLVKDGHKTEWRKIKEGWADLMFYGHASDDGGLPAWMVLNLDSFRHQWNTQRPHLKWGEQLNGDGTGFIWFDASSFPDRSSLLVASSGIAFQMTLFEQFYGHI